jgi:hypothetical protein
LLVVLQEEVCELVLSISYRTSIIIFKSILNLCAEKMLCGYFNHRYNISPIHLHSLLGVENFTKVVHVCAHRL